MSTIDIAASGAATTGNVADAEEINSRLAGGSVFVGETLLDINGRLTADNFALLTSEVVDRESLCVRSPPSASTRPQDYMEDLFEDDEEPEHFAGGAAEFEVDSYTQYVTFYWTVTFSSIKQKPRFVGGRAASTHRVSISVDGERVSGASRNLPLSTFAVWVYGYSSGGVIPIPSHWNDRMVGRGRTWTGHRVLDVVGLSEGKHTVGLGAWCEGDGTMRIHSAACWVEVRRN